ncbi:MAG: hypothetical protein RI996_154 [Candidatus Parcubacteria bacterium]|jgi:hypothetical protein
MQNNLFNLINQLTQESKSLWRIKDQYQKDAQTDEQRAFWLKIQKEKEQTVAELQEMVKKEMQ